MDANALDVLCKDIYRLANLFYPVRERKSEEIRPEEIAAIKSVAFQTASQLKFEAEKTSFEVTRADELFVVSLKSIRTRSDLVRIGGALYLVLDQSPKVLCTLAGR